MDALVYAVIMSKIQKSGSMQGIYAVPSRDLNLTCDTIRETTRHFSHGEQYVADQLYRACVHKIQRQSRLEQGTLHYTLPNSYQNFQLNRKFLPKYNTERIADIVSGYLRHEGFAVTYTSSTRSLYIDWRVPVQVCTHASGSNLSRDMRQIVHQKRKRRGHMYDTLVAQCKKKIRQSIGMAKALGKQQQCDVVWWMMPRALLGFPTYDTEAALAYVIRNLRESGFTVTRHIERARVIAMSGWNES